MPPGDSVALAATLKKVLALNTSQREDLAGKAIANVREKFSRIQMCASTLKVYEEILSGSDPAVAALEESPVLPA